MSFADRLWDDEGFTAPPLSSMPTVLAQLIVLGLYDAPHEQQVAGMRAWLKENTPTASLRADLADNMPELLCELAATA